MVTQTKQEALANVRRNEQRLRSTPSTAPEFKNVYCDLSRAIKFALKAGASLHEVHAARMEAARVIVTKVR